MAHPWDTVAQLVGWLDRNAKLPPEQEQLMRILKISEEVGEVSEALAGVLSSNPRKGRSHTEADLQAELCDVVLTAMVALRSRTPDADQVFRRHLDRVARRSLPDDRSPTGTHDLHLQPEYHQLVASGAKTVEVRTASPAKTAIRVGDQIIFHTDDDAPLTCKVVRVSRYADFAALLDHEDSATINPTTDRDGILAALHGIYPPEKQQLGALAIEIRAPLDSETPGSATVTIPPSRES
ncbi:ASCH domain-containing protein [Kitasatospora sp. NPDC048545]|uniref:ASCH domain-containing protein n=1 Tax=Kitasatospora sp. NPDC048545 TaxID=3157208 RepID=UPI0033C82963